MKRRDNRQSAPMPSCVPPACPDCGASTVHCRRNRTVLGNLCTACGWQRWDKP